MRLLDVYAKAQDTHTFKGKRMYKIRGNTSQEAGILKTESNRTKV